MAIANLVVDLTSDPSDVGFLPDAGYLYIKAEY